MRTVPFARLEPLFQELGPLDRAVLERFLSKELTEAQFLQAQIKVRNGGLGYFDTANLQPGAYVSSRVATKALRARLSGQAVAQMPPDLLLLDHVNRFNALIPAAKHLNPTTLNVVKHTQKALSKIVNKVKLKALRELHKDSPADLTRLRSCGGKGAGSFLKTPPQPQRSPSILPVHFKTAIKYRLGVNQNEGAVFCNQLHGGGPVRLDPLGAHAVGCKPGGQVIWRHEQVEAWLIGTGSISNLRMQRQPHLMDLIPDATTNRRPDILIHSLNGRDVVTDVTIVEPTHNSNQLNARTVNGFSANQAESAKIAKYRADLAPRATFTPFAVETYGTLGDHARDLLWQIARHISHHTDVSLPLVKRKLLIELSVIVQRNVAAAIFRRSPASAVFAEGASNSPVRGQSHRSRRV